MLIDKVQNQLQQIYAIDVSERAQDYLIDREGAMSLIQPSSADAMPKELLLVKKPADDTVELALYLDYSLLANLTQNDPFLSINRKNLSDFCILIEGVSHFVYYLWKARLNQNITQLELELQAEIDKFLMLYLYLRNSETQGFSWELVEMLFDDFSLVESLSVEQKDRYLTASTLAAKYCSNLQRKFHQQKNIERLIDEVRGFYHMPQEQKIQHIIN